MAKFSVLQFRQQYRDALMLLIDMSLEEMDAEPLLSDLVNMQIHGCNSQLTLRIKQMYLEQADEPLDGQCLDLLINLLSATIRLEIEDSP